MKAYSIPITHADSNQISISRSRAHSLNSDWNTPFLPAQIGQHWRDRLRSRLLRMPLRTVLGGMMVCGLSLSGFKSGLAEEISEVSGEGDKALILPMPTGDIEEQKTPEGMSVVVASLLLPLPIATEVGREPEPPTEGELLVKSLVPGGIPGGGPTPIIGAPAPAPPASAPPAPAANVAAVGPSSGNSSSSTDKPNAGPGSTPSVAANSNTNTGRSLGQAPSGAVALGNMGSNASANAKPKPTANEAQVATTKVETTAGVASGKSGGPVISLSSLKEASGVNRVAQGTSVYEDESGKPVDASKLTSNQPVTVHYTKVGDTLYASKVVVKGTRQGPTTNQKAKVVTAERKKSKARS